MRGRSFSALDKALVLLIVVALGFIAIPSVRSIGYDDAYITFRHAYNLVGGHGLVYNPGEVFLGTSAPGYGIALAAFSLPWPSAIHIVANVFSALTLIASALALFEYCRMRGWRFLGFACALFFGTCPMLILTFGGEMLVQLAIVLWAFVLVDKKHYLPATWLVAIGCLVRPDTGIAAVIVFVVLFIQTRRFPTRELLTFLLVVGVFYGAIWIMYGSPIPGSVLAKASQRGMGGWNDFLVDAPNQLKSMGLPLSFSRWAGPRASADIAVVKALFVLGTFGLLFRHRYWFKPMAWSGAVFLFFAITNPPSYHWYLIPLLWPFAVIAALGLDTIVAACRWGFQRLLSAQNPSWTARALQAGVLLLFTPALISQAFAGLAHLEVKTMTYIEIAKWLRARVPPGASIMHFEIGYLGYYLPNHKIVDPLGLVHPKVAQEFAAGDALAAFHRYHPDVVLRRGAFLGRDASELPGFHDRYVLIGRHPGDPTPPGTPRQVYDIYMKRDMARRAGRPGKKPFLSLTIPEAPRTPSRTSGRVPC